MNTPKRRKIFLSHKGADKALVIDFKKTLDLIDCEPWLDEDAMPAGAPLERALLQGMEQSEAVVFFLTPSFKDEGYLAKEIDYAVRQKELKGDGFSIITLQFPREGAAVTVPSLLRGYVWKEPRTLLEALREILRALPHRMPSARTEETPDPSDTKPPTKPLPALTPEAQALLKEAADTDGTIIHTRTLGGEHLQCGRREMMTDQSPRSVARWKGALDDLRHLGYVRGLGHKGELFELTREGYAAADRLTEVQSS